FGAPDGGGLRLSRLLSDNALVFICAWTASSTFLSFKVGRSNDLCRKTSKVSIFNLHSILLRAHTFNMTLLPPLHWELYLYQRFWRLLRMRSPEVESGVQHSEECFSARDRKHEAHYNTPPRLSLSKDPELRSQEFLLLAGRNGFTSTFLGGMKHLGICNVPSKGYGNRSQGSAIIYLDDAAGLRRENGWSAELFSIFHMLDST
ncbi:hypothetical protein WG66_007156, partial [Moniliophthora roreri]